MNTKNLTSFASVALGAILLTLAPSVEAMTYYISPTGDDQASGTTAQQAWATFDRAWKDLYPGDTLLVMDGTYYQAFAPNVRNGQPNPAIDTADYVSYPLDHTERTKCYITVKAMHDGKAVIDGQNVRSTVRLGYWEQGGFGSYFILDGLIARNSIDHVYYILSHNVIIRRCSGYNANTDENTHVFGIYAQGTPADPANLLLEDSVAGGSGRKMFMAYSTYVNVIFRRLFAAWGEWRGAGPTYRPNNWPWGDGIEIYNSDQPAGVTNSIVENSIVYGKLANYGFSLAPNPALTQGNKFLGDMAVKVGMRWDDTPMRGELSPDEGGDLIPDMTKDWPCPNPARTDIHCTEFTKWQGTRAGFDFGVYSVPTFLSNTFQDLFAWGNAGPGIAIGEPPMSIGWDPSSSGNVLNRVTLVNNGLGDPPPWEKLQGYPNIADYSLKMIGRAGSAQNLYIEGDTRYTDKSAGARLRYRYVNGQLMDGSNGQAAQELWPWPMEQRIKDELGISVTCELGNLINQYTASPITSIAMDAFCTGKDTVAPSVPASVTAGPVSTSQINLSWSASTDNVAVAGYRIYRNGSVTGTATSNLYADTGLTAATGYTYTVSAYDAAGNVSAQSSAAFATTLAPDTIPPSVNITAPGSGVAVSGVLAVSAKASDNVGVAGVQFKLDGAGLGAETSVSPYSVSWNTGGIANGKHVLTAVARDAAGNLTSSAQVTVSVANSVSVKPVVAYSFDQGSGTTLTDSSGNGHDGDISNGTWITGRFGKALSFSGTGFVRIGDLDVSPALTASAWINASALSGCHSAVMKTLTYGFEICDGNLLAEIGNGSSWSGTTKIAAAANVWQYITETFDGSTIKLYKDGILVASSAGTLTDSNQDLRIGAWTDASEFFVGLIDEVRIYSRALSQAEIQADMNTPVGGTGDATAPSVPLGLTAAAQSYNQIALSWSASTDNVGVTGYRIYRNGSSIATAAATTYQDTGLSPLATYTYTISAYDAAGNTSAQSLPASATTAGQPDTIAPAVAITAPKPNQSVSGMIIVSATASDNIEVKGVQIKLDGASLGAEATASPYAVSWDTGGVGAGLHVLTAVARDAAGNQTTSTPVTVSVSAATGPLSIVNISDNRSSYSNGRIPRYAKLEVTFDVRNTVATNLQLPFDPNPPTGINPGSYPLHKGISVDLLVTHDNWATVHRQPAFVYQGYDDQLKVSWSGQNREWHYPAGSLVWKARFSPTQSGAWQYKIVAQDSSGSTESAVQTISVSTSASRGFVKVSKKDPRYFEFDDGSPFTTIGLNEVLHFDNPTLNMEPLFQTYAANGVNFLRLWASGLYGSAWLEWIGGRNIYDGYLPRAGLEAFHDPVSNRDQLTQVIKYDGANLDSGWYDACRFQFWDDPESVKPNTTYKLSIKYWGKDIAGPRLASQADYGLVGKITTDWVPNCYEPGTGMVITGYGQSTSNWSTIEGTWHSGSNNFLPRIYLGLENATQGKAYIDSISLREDLGNGQFGPELITESSMQYELYAPQKSSYSLDKVVQLAEKYGIYLKLVLEDKNDMIYQKLDQDGTFVLSGEQDNLAGFYGLGRTLNKTKWLHQAWWRYVQARWGYSPAVHSWELTNEGDPWLTRHYEMADELGKFMHCGVFGVSVGSGDGQKCNYKHPDAHLVTTSFWTSFPATQFWKNASYPNVDYADLHAYISTSDIGLSATELGKMQWDSAYYHLGHSKEIGGWKLGKPVVRGEAGIDSTKAQVEQPDLAKDTHGIWLHKFLWSTIDTGAMPELYWWRENIQRQPGTDGVAGLYEIFRTFSNFVKGIPVNNGNYTDAQGIATDARLRVIGQKDPVNGRAHLWLDNSAHTWKSVVDNAGITPITSSVTIANMPVGSYAVTWFDTYSGATTTTTINSSAQGLTLPVSQLSTDIAVKIEKK